jgi:acyl carrier protein
MANRDELKALLQEVFLLTPEEFRFDMTRDDVETWDSLGVVSLAVGVHETFGYHMTPEEASSLRSFGDVVAILESKGIRFDEPS